MFLFLLLCATVCASLFRVPLLHVLWMLCAVCVLARKNASSLHFITVAISTRHVWRRHALARFILLLKLQGNQSASRRFSPKCSLASRILTITSNGKSSHGKFYENIPEAGAEVFIEVLGGAGRASNS